MSLEKWFEKFGTETDSTESITNETFSYLASCEEFTLDDRKFLNSLDYSDDDIAKIEEIMNEVD